MSDLPQISDEMVDAYSRKYSAVWKERAPVTTQGEAVAVDRDATRAGLAAALAASGWRPEAEVRAEVADNLNRFADRARERAYQYAPELPICARRSNDCVTNAYYLAATTKPLKERLEALENELAQSERGGPLGHETSECQWRPCNSEGDWASSLDSSPAPVAESKTETVEQCGSDIGVFKPRRCVLPKGHGGDWHDDGSACWSVKEPADG